MIQSDLQYVTQNSNQILMLGSKNLIRYLFEKFMVIDLFESKNIYFFQTKILLKILSLCSFFFPFLFNLALMSKQRGSRKWAFGSINLSLK